jgi:hypothetical protein
MDFMGISQEKSPCSERHYTRSESRCTSARGCLGLMAGLMLGEGIVGGCASGLG